MKLNIKHYLAALFLTIVVGTLAFGAYLLSFGFPLSDAGSFAGYPALGIPAILLAFPFMVAQSLGWLKFLNPDRWAYAITFYVFEYIYFLFLIWIIPLVLKFARGSGDIK